jgi:hypothetical protein
MLKKIIFLLFLPISGIAADNCITFKQMPDVQIKNPRYKQEVVQPDEPMNVFHGNVLATLVEDYDIIVDIVATHGGYCVTLKKIDASIGYSDFFVKIDKSHRYGSCSYNAILNHEKKHVNAYMSVTDDLNSDIKNSVFNAADSIMPVFVENRKDIDLVMEDMNYEIRNHPEIVLIKQKINAAQEIRNKRIDLDEDNYELKSCLANDR